MWAKLVCDLENIGMVRWLGFCVFFLDFSSFSWQKFILAEMRCEVDETVNHPDAEGSVQIG